MSTTTLDLPKAECSFLIQSGTALTLVTIPGRAESLSTPNGPSAAAFRGHALLVTGNERSLNDLSCT